MLFVIGAQAAVVRTSALGMGLGRQRAVAGLQIVLGAFPVGCVGRDQGFLDAMFLAALLIEDVLALDQDLAGTSLRHVSHKLVVWAWNR